jgi:hypothetical protein
MARKVVVYTPEEYRKEKELKGLQALGSTGVGALVGFTVGGPVGAIVGGILAAGVTGVVQNILDPDCRCK